MSRDPKAEVEVSAHSRNLSQRLAEARAKFAKFGHEVRSTMNGKELMTGGFLGTGSAKLVGNIGSRAAAAAGDWLGDQAKSAWKYADSLKRLEIQAGKSPAYMQAFSQSIRTASDATGLNKNEILGAARTYVALTGDMDGARASIGTWARVAQASEASIADVASTAQAMRDNLKIKPEEMEAAFGALITQGKEGAVELKDLASQLAIVSPLMSQFKGGSGLSGLRELGAVVQVVRKGFGGTEETITGVQSVMTALIKNAKRFQAAGVQIYDKDPKTGVKSLRNFHDIITAISESKLMKDPTKMVKAFGRVEAYRAYLQLKDNAGMMDDLIAKSQDAGVVQRDLDSYMQSSAGRTSQAWEQAKNKLAEAFTPERIEAFANLAIKLAGALGLIADKVGGVLDGAKEFGGGVAEIVFGQSEDRRAELGRRDYQRRRMLEAGKQYASSHAGFDFSDEDDRKSAVRYAIGKVNSEDELRKRIDAGEDVQRKVLAPNDDFSESWLPVKSASVRSGSIEDLAQLRNSPEVQGATNSKYLVDAINAAIVRAMAQQMAALQKIVDNTAKTAENAAKGTKVQVDGKTVVEANRGAPRGTRPGG